MEMGNGNSVTIQDSKNYSIILLQGQDSLCLAKDVENPRQLAAKP